MKGKRLTTFLFSITILAVLIFGCKKNEEPVTPEPASSIGTLSITPSGILVSTSTEILVKLEVPSGIALVDSAVKIVRVDDSNNPIADFGFVYDNGDLSNGDEIIGDNIYSGLIPFAENAPGTLRLMATANADMQGNAFVGNSEVNLLTVFSNLTGQEFSEIIATQDNAANKIDELLAGNVSNVQNAVDGTVQWLQTQPQVASVSSQGFTSIEITYKSGLYGAMIISLEDASGSVTTRGGYAVDDTRNKSGRIPVSKQTVGTYDDFYVPFYKSTSTDELDPKVIGNRNVFIFAPFEAVFAPFNERTKIENNLNSSDFEFQITSLVNQAATVSSLFNLTQYGLVVLATHGSQGKIFLTGEIVDTNAVVYTNSYKALLKAGKIGISGRLTISSTGTVEKKAKVYYIRPTFISSLTGKFPNSVILNNSCEGTMNPDLENAFIGKGAKTYYGYSKVVNSDFCVTIADSITKRLAKDLKNTGEAYMNQSDPSSPFAHFDLKGANDVHYTDELINGDFEFGKVDGWTKDGDGRVISKLVTVGPTGGNYMGIISTGLGFTTATGKIFQSFRVEENQSTLTVKWNFLSEEFLEFINTAFQDFFKVIIKKKDGTETVLLSKTIDDLASDFGAQKFNNEPNEVPKPGNLIGVSPGIVFDRGDVYMTNWQTSTFDITAFRGKIITLILSAGDVGDSIYDTAILLDDIAIN